MDPATNAPFWATPEQVHISTIAVYTLERREGVVEEDSPLVTQGDTYAVSKARRSGC